MALALWRELGNFSMTSFRVFMPASLASHSSNCHSEMRNRRKDASSSDHSCSSYASLNEAMAISGCWSFVACSLAMSVHASLLDGSEIMDFL